MMEKKQTVGEKFKGHFKKHKVKYMVVGGVVVGTGLGVLGYKIYSDRKFDELKESVDGLTTKIGDCQGGTINIGESVGIGDNNVIDASVKIYNKLGHPGNKIMCDQTKVLYDSQSDAAKAMGLNPTKLSEHLNGKKPSVNGYTFTRMVPEDS